MEFRQNGQWDRQCQYDGISYPLVFKIYESKSRLKANGAYKSKPPLAVEIIREVQAMGFVIERVLADSLYGESGDVTGGLHPLKLPYIVAICAIELCPAKGVHGIWLLKGQRVRYNRWRAYDQP